MKMILFATLVMIVSSCAHKSKKTEAQDPSGESFFSSRYGVTAKVHAHNFSMVLDKKTPSQIRLNNSPDNLPMYKCFTSRVSIEARDSIDCKNAANYTLVQLTPESEWMYKDNGYQLKDSFLRTLPANFYSVYFRKDPNDERSEVYLTFFQKDDNPYSCDEKDKDSRP